MKIHCLKPNPVVAMIKVWITLKEIFFFKNFLKKSRKPTLKDTVLIPIHLEIKHVEKCLRGILSSSFWRPSSFGAFKRDEVMVRCGSHGAARGGVLGLSSIFGSDGKCIFHVYMKEFFIFIINLRIIKCNIVLFGCVAGVLSQFS